MSRPINVIQVTKCKLREELPQVYSSRAGLIGYIFASWMREEIDLHKEITRHNEKIESVMLQLQQDHQTGKLRSNSAQNSRQNSRENRESEGLWCVNKES